MTFIPSIRKYNENINSVLKLGLYITEEEKRSLRKRSSKIGVYLRRKFCQKT